MATALVALEGVLMTEVGDPIPEGIRLFRILSASYRVVICSDMSQAHTEHWLRSHLITGQGDVYDNRYFFEGQDLRSRQLAVALNGGRVDLFVDPDADRCAEAVAMGITALLFAAPKFVRTKRIVKPWEDVVNEVERQKLALLEAELGSSVKRYE